MTGKQKIKLQSLFFTFFTLTAISCSGNILSGSPLKYSEDDIAFIEEYKGVGVRYKLGKPYKIAGNMYFPRHEPSYDVTGVASWYGPNVDDITANGEPFDPEKVTAAHPTLPLPSIVEVENLDNGLKLVVRINDRGPFTRDRVIDLSKGAARELDMLGSGVANVRVRLMQEDTLDYMEAQIERPTTSDSNGFIPTPQQKPTIKSVQQASNSAVRKMAIAHPIVD